MPVSSTHPEYDKYVAEWQRNQIAFDGEMAVKEHSEMFYPMFVPKDQERYDAVINGSYFKETPARTVLGLQGSVFRKDPVINLPDALSYMLEDADGMGSSLIQMAKGSFNQVFIAGREGLLVDMPPVPEGTTNEQVASMYLRPSIVRYSPGAVINWKIVMVGSKSVLSMLVLKEDYEGADSADPYVSKTKTRYRVIQLTDAGVLVRIVDENDDDIEDPYFPLDSTRQPWKMIPFVFIGSESNTPACDKPPLSGIASIALAQYRNIVDEEENLHMHGQLT
ncbi:MAG: hypothetical protein R3204_10540, partial [Oceanospirillum sp.]|nr:hypothetical protein [Oceanospirillum sp.]